MAAAWTSEEDERIIAWYLAHPDKAQHAKLTGRSDAEVSERARSLGLIRGSGGIATSAIAWTREEDDRLFNALAVQVEGGARLWQRVAKAVMTRSPDACRERAKKIGATPLLGISRHEYYKAAQMLESGQTVKRMAASLGLEIQSAYVLAGRIYELKNRKVIKQ
jgi:hypothetical protein